MAAYSASLRGASRIYVIDKVPERLAAAKKIPGAIPIDFSAGDAVEAVIKENGGKMVDRSVDAVGYQAVGSGKGEGEVPNVVLEQCIMVTRPTGGIGVPGLYVPADPGAPDEKAAKGMMMMSFGKLFEKVKRAIIPIDGNNPLTNSAGSYDWYGTVQCQEVQPVFERHDRFRTSRPQLRCIA